MRKNEDAQYDRLLGCGKAVLVGGGAAFGLCLLLLFAAAAAISRGLLAPEVEPGLTVGACLTASLLGGILGVRLSPGQRLPVGLCTGCVLFLLQLTLGLILYDNVSLENGGISYLCAELCGGAAAGVLARGGKRMGARGKKRRRH